VQSVCVSVYEMTQPACHQLDGGARTIYDYDYEVPRPRRSGKQRRCGHRSDAALKDELDELKKSL
jgi:hypothetical protein